MHSHATLPPAPAERHHGLFITIESFAERGYRLGLVGHCASMMARFYGARFGFGADYEGETAARLGHFLATFDARRSAFWTVRRDHEVVGCAALDGRDEAEPQLRWFYLSPALRGQGVGRRLLRRALDAARGLGWRELALYTHEDLRPAVHLYEQHGFVRHGVRIAPHWQRAMTFTRFVRDLQATARPAAPMPRLAVAA